MSAKEEGRSARTFGSAGQILSAVRAGASRLSNQLLTIVNAKRLDLGSQKTSNERSIFQFTTTIETCQIVVGMTQLARGSVWNTMPAHVHDRRMEAYLYLISPTRARVPLHGRAGRDPAHRHGQ
jgi:5-keto 4-deoxyuronate isomerase